MSLEVESVRVERDNGHRDRWAFGRWFYRKEGQKESLATRRIGYALGGLFALSCFYLVIKGPEPPVSVNIRGIQIPDDPLTASQTFETIPPVSSTKPFEKKTSSNLRSYVGIEHVERPRLTTFPVGLSAEAKLNSAASDGKVFAEIAADIVFQGETLIPQGTLISGIGKTSGDRLEVTFTKVRYADGKEQNISAEAVDITDGGIGLKGSKVSKYLAAMTAAGALSFAGGLADGLQENEVQNGVAIRKSNLRNAALNGSAHAALDTSKDIISTWKDKKAVVMIKAGSRISIIFSEN